LKVRKSVFLTQGENCFGALPGTVDTRTLFEYLCEYEKNQIVLVWKLGFRMMMLFLPKIKYKKNLFTVPLNKHNRQLVSSVKCFKFAFD
jgi:hypothetical protein